MTDAEALVLVVKSRLDGAQLMSHLSSRLRSYQKSLGSAETEVSRLLRELKEDSIALKEASALFRAKAKVVAVTALLRACDREIEAQKVEFLALDQWIDTNRAARMEHGQ